MKRKKSNVYADSAKRNINYLVEEFCDGKQVVFCMKTGINKGSVSQYCNGSNVPNNLTAKKIADAFGVDPAWVMGFDVPMKPNKMVIVADKLTLDVQCQVHYTHFDVFLNNKKEPRQNALAPPYAYVLI